MKLKGRKNKIIVNLSQGRIEQPVCQFLAQKVGLVESAELI